MHRFLNIDKNKSVLYSLNYNNLFKQYLLRGIMEYQAIFGIDCGVSTGFALKDLDYVRRTEEISADSPEMAYDLAMVQARRFANDYLSNPETELTAVQLLSLNGPNGLVVPFDASKAIVKCSMLEHLLSNI